MLPSTLTMSTPLQPRVRNISVVGVRVFRRYRYDFYTYGPRTRTCPDDLPVNPLAQGKTVLPITTLDMAF